MQKSPDSDKRLPLNLIVLHRNFRAVPFSVKLKPLRNGSFKISNKQTEVAYELLTQYGKTFHTHRKHLIPIQFKQLSLFPPIESYSEQNSEIFHESDITDMILKDLYTSYDNFEFDVNDF